MRVTQILVISSIILFSLLTDIDLEGSYSNETKTRHVNFVASGVRQRTGVG
jgi:hypothetical protein